jgi:hypothetical protein
MVGFIDYHREKFGVEPICAVLPIAPSVYYERRARCRDPNRRPPRVRRDDELGCSGALVFMCGHATFPRDTSSAWRGGTHSVRFPNVLPRGDAIKRLTECRIDLHPRLGCALRALLGACSGG